MRFTKVTWVALGFAALDLLGYALSAIYDLPSCTGGPCDGGQALRGLALVFYPGGTGLEAPWFLTVVFLIGILISLRASRWGLVGLVVIILYSAGFVEGELSEQLTVWAANNNFGLGLFTWVSAMVAAGVVVLAIEEVVMRARHGWRLSS
jgi:hypothetical protein